MGLKEKIDNITKDPGVYLFKDKDGNIIYIGKAASIKKRLKSHFVKDGYGRHKALIDNVDDVDYICTPDESSALLFEAALIKRYRPKYNVSLRDDKSYPRLKLTINEEYPRLFITRKIKEDGAIYFGPYTNSKLLRKALTFMKQLFPLRTCLRLPKSSCLNYHLGQCLAPCIDSSKKHRYDKIVNELRLFLDGQREELLKALTAEMDRVSKDKDYEQAAKIRDRIRALSLVSEGSQLSSLVHGETCLPTGSQYHRSTIIPSQQIEQLRSILGLAKRPSVIEAFDISNMSGKEAVGSMVYFKDGKPVMDECRRFKIRTVNVIDDYSMMREIVSRRYRRLLGEESPMPDLIVIDGGKGHLAAAKKELRNLRLLDVAVISIAKKPDKIYTSENKEPILVGNFEGVLFLIQRIRDEAHRFAIDYYRLLHRKSISSSEIDNIKGIGPKRKSYLIRHFGSLDEIRLADIEDLKKVRYISEKEAKAIYNYFH